MAFPNKTNGHRSVVRSMLTITVTTNCQLSCSSNTSLNFISLSSKHCIWYKDLANFAKTLHLEQNPSLSLYGFNHKCNTIRIGLNTFSKHLNHCKVHGYPVHIGTKTIIDIGSVELEIAGRCSPQKTCYLEI